MRSSNLYKNKFKKYGVDPKALLWKSRGAAHQRFRQFWAEIDFDNKKVLDIGCGFGEFGRFLLKRYKNVNYTGIDNVQEFIENAKKLVPGGKFYVGDYLKDQGWRAAGSPEAGVPKVGGFGADARQDPEDGNYNVVIASGVLNSNTGASNFADRKLAIAKMFSLTSDVLAFNMLGGHPAPENDNKSNIWYSDSLQILNYCMSLTRRVILRENYHPKDFTVIMYKTKK